MDWEEGEQLPSFLFVRAERMRGTGRIFCVGVEKDGAGAGLAFDDALFLVPPCAAVGSEDVGCRSWQQHVRCMRSTSLPVARFENIQKTSVSVRVGLAQERCFWYLLHAAWILCQEGAEVLTAQQHLSLISDPFPDNAVSVPNDERIALQDFREEFFVCFP